MNGQISRIEIAELEDLLRDEACLDYYLRIAEIEAGLQLVEATGNRLMPPAPAPRHPVVMRHDSHFPILLAAAALAALLLVASVLIWHQPKAIRLTETPPPPTTDALPQTATPVVTMSRCYLADLSDRPLHAGDRVSITIGVAEFTTTAGSRIILEAPAQLEFTSPTEFTLLNGRCVVWAPRAVAKTLVHTPLGTVSADDSEFAVEVFAAEGRADIGILEGHALVYLPSDSRPFRLDHEQSLRLGVSENYDEPFDSASFLRHFPSQELAWSAPTDGFQASTIDHDLKGLIWGPGDYFVRFKWERGVDALAIHSAELLCDGRVVSTDTHQGMSGNWHYTKDNTYSFTITAQDYRRGHWTLRTGVQVKPRKLADVQLPNEFLAKHEDILLADGPRLTQARQEVFLNATVEPDSEGLIRFEHGLGASTQASLMLHYTFDEGAGETARSSVYSTTGNSLTLTNLGTDTDWAPGKIGSGAVRIISSAGLARAADPASWGVTSPNVSLALWVNLDDSSDQAAPNLAGALNNTTHSHQYLIRADSRGLRAGGFVRDADQIHMIQTLRSPSTAIPENTWTHLAMTFEQESKTLKFYLNGILIQEKTANKWAAWGEAVELDFAGLGHPGNYSLSGLYDDVRIYDSVLKPEDIRILAAE